MPGMRCASDWGNTRCRLYPDKTRLIEFGRFAAAQRARRGLVEFLGGRSRHGRFALKRKTRYDRMRASRSWLVNKYRLIRWLRR